ncbi:hypothetical protein B0H13DRAFT_930588 [Mycena leptocephala]|nr:hypothetical protein B0H13DRAFT_930588 [Mycena leptocephala]
MVTPRDGQRRHRHCREACAPTTASCGAQAPIAACAGHRSRGNVGAVVRDANGNAPRPAHWDMAAARARSRYACPNWGVEVPRVARVPMCRGAGCGDGCAYGVGVGCESRACASGFPARSVRCTGVKTMTGGEGRADGWAEVRPPKEGSSRTACPRWKQHSSQCDGAAGFASLGCSATSGWGRSQLDHSVHTRACGRGLGWSRRPVEAARNMGDVAGKPACTVRMARKLRKVSICATSYH